MDDAAAWARSLPWYSEFLTPSKNVCMYVCICVRIHMMMVGAWVERAHASKQNIFRHIVESKCWRRDGALSSMQHEATNQRNNRREV